MRYSVTFQRQVTTQDTTGQRNDTWTNIDTVRAAIDPISGREFTQQSGEHSDITTRIRVRYRDSLSALKQSDRAVHGSVEYNIQSIINVQERNRELVLMCERIGS